MLGKFPDGPCFPCITSRADLPGVNPACVFDGTHCECVPFHMTLGASRWHFEAGACVASNNCGPNYVIGLGTYRKGEHCVGDESDHVT